MTLLFSHYATFSHPTEKVRKYQPNVLEDSAISWVCKLRVQIWMQRLGGNKILCYDLSSGEAKRAEVHMALPGGPADPHCEVFI